MGGNTVNRVTENNNIEIIYFQGEITMRKNIIRRIVAVLTATLVFIIEISRYTIVKADEISAEYSLEKTVVCSWEEGYQGEIVLKNLTDKKMTNWSLSVSTKCQITDLWGGVITDSQIVSENEMTYNYTIEGYNYNDSIKSGESVSIGYIIYGSYDETFDISVNYILSETDGSDNQLSGDDKDNSDNSIEEQMTPDSEIITYTGSGYTVEVQIPESWDNAYNVKMQITNTSSETLHNWGFLLKTSDDISGLYNAVEISEHESVRLFKNAGYNQDIPAGGTIEIGYTAYYSEEQDIPDEFVLASIEKNVEQLDYQVELFVTDEWDDGAIANIIIENTSELAIEDWEMVFDSDISVEEIWGGVLVSHEGNNYVLRNADYAQNIGAGEYWTVDLKISGCISDIENIDMTKIVVTDDIGEIDFDDTTDTDGDGIPDTYEIAFGTDSSKVDTDGDGLNDYEEIFILGTDPTIYDSVISGVFDYDIDSDEDGISNGDEIELGLNPMNKDTDYDRLSDGDEISVYYTDPLNVDSDGDTLSDGDEILIGLDPLNPETYGVPDAEYIINQYLDVDCEALSEINDKETVYQLSLSVNAAGYAGNMIVEESAYSNVLSNDSVIGLIPSFYYENNLEEMTISFHISDQLIDNELGTYAAYNDEFRGIKRLAVAYYSEELQVCLPIDTKYDEVNNVVYTTVSNQGTYCLIDMEKWLDMIDFSPEDFEIENILEINSIDESFIQNLYLHNDSIQLFTAYASMPDISYDKYEYRGHYYARIPISMTWEEARDYCESIGGHLATITDAEEQAFIEENLLGISSLVACWLGGYTKDTVDHFEWITGEPFEYTNWRHGEPNLQSEKWLHLYDSTNSDYFGLWNNAHDYGKAYCICEWEDEEYVISPMFFAVTMNPVPNDFGPISTTNINDYDGDGLKNNQEIDFSKMMTINSLGTPVTLFDLYSYFEVETGLTNGTNRFITDKALTKFMGVYIVLIKSDPTLVDTDNDGLFDGLNDGEGVIDINPLSYDDYPDKFTEMINQRIINQSDIVKSNDGFIICLAPISDILEKYGYNQKSLDSYSDRDNGLDYYFDCWFPFCIQTGQEEALGMVKLCCEDNNRTPKIAVPFIELSSDIFQPYSEENAIYTDQELERVSICSDDNDPNSIIIEYFCSAYSEGLYIIPELYINQVIEKEVKDGILNICNNEKEYNICQYAKDTISYYKVGNGTEDIYDEDNNQLLIDTDNLSLAQKQCILSVRTNNPNYNSVAAEIVYHARIANALSIPRYHSSFDTTGDIIDAIIRAMYRSAIKADLSVDDNYKPESDYKDKNGIYMQEQIAIWGEL